ncbi:NAD(P)-dependent alcohol dehydrogenase [Paenibacillus antri]|uniref:NAD(P)-dependent alcohol dehydrogenase n=2 Tax=Paenibacillus antri TaxID=2582848 RepID=A0A5R9GDK6_9BACL|nr:NAD(P)-dependent alcohol dehydrogenase [Paenibacillus antri]TLS50733.1 NAD(P)-dependent alcohol dehydrogenase [Paenibacillus antri]
MKAMMYTSYGTAERLALQEAEKPIPASGEALIRVYAASLNSWDWDLLRGKPWLTRLEGLRTPKYSILGADIAGRVEAVGSGVHAFRPGDEVFGDLSGCGFGGFSEYVSARADVLSLKPAGMSFEEAASVPQAGVLALQGLRVKGGIKRGQNVLINGGGGGVGTFAVQLAKMYGADATVVDAAGKLDKLVSIGADRVVDYAAEDISKMGETYDLVLDVVGNRSALDFIRILRPQGSYVMVGGAVRRLVQLLLLGPLLSMATRKKLSILIHRPNPQDLRLLGEFYAAGKLAPVIDRCYPLREAAEAFEYFGSGRHVGKIVIRMEPES